MLDARLYGSAYILVVTILTLIQMAKYANFNNNRLAIASCYSTKSTFLLSLVLSLIIGLRPLHVAFVDMMNYYHYYMTLYWRGEYTFSWDHENLLFDNMFAYLAQSQYPITLFYLIMALGYFGLMYLACRKMFPKDCFYAYVIYLGAFSTFSYATNGVKAGVAASIFLCALAYKEDKLKALLLLAISFGFHHSMMLPVAAYIVCLFYKNTKTYFYVWLLCILIAAMHITVFQDLFGSMSDERGAAYLSVDQEDGDFYTGFRPDFIFYSSFPVVAGYYAIFKHQYQSKKYSFLFNVYLLTNSIWMLCMYANFTNRIAYLSWFMLPIVLVYPFFDKAFVPHQYKKLNFVAFGHVMFTVMMQVVYYAYIK